MSGFLGLGWDKGVNGHATDWIKINLPNTQCTSLNAPQANILRENLEQEINDKVEACASYVKQNRFGSSRDTALADCRGKITSKYQPCIDIANSKGVVDSDFIKSKIQSSNPIVIIGIFLFIGIIMYLLLSKK